MPTAEAAQIASRYLARRLAVVMYVCLGPAAIVAAGAFYCLVHRPELVTVHSSDPLLETAIHVPGAAIVVVIATLICPALLWFAGSRQGAAGRRRLAHLALMLGGFLLGAVVLSWVLGPVLLRSLTA